MSTNTCTGTAARCCSYQTDGPAVATKVIFFLPPYTLCSRDFCSGAIRYIRASRHMLHAYIPVHLCSLASHAMIAPVLPRTRLNRYK